MSILIGMLESGDEFSVSVKGIVYIYEVVYVINHNRVTTGNTSVVEVLWRIWNPLTGEEVTKWTNYVNPLALLRGFEPISKRSEIPL